MCCALCATYCTWTETLQVVHLLLVSFHYCNATVRMGANKPEARQERSGYF